MIAIIEDLNTASLFSVTIHTVFQSIFMVNNSHTVMSNVMDNSRTVCEMNEHKVQVSFYSLLYTRMNIYLNCYMLLYTNYLFVKQFYLSIGSIQLSLLH